MASGSEIDVEIGRTLNRLRTERSLTVTQLAAKANLSTAMISRIENGHVSPSLSSMHALADALSVSLMALFSHSNSAADVHHVKAGQGLPSRRLTPDHAHDYLMLGKHSGPSGIFQASRIRILRENSGTLPSYQHEGYVFIYMIEGEATYGCGEEQFEMSAGDTLSFDAKLPHGFKKIRSPAIEFITTSTRPA